MGDGDNGDAFWKVGAGWPLCQPALLHPALRWPRQGTGVWVGIKGAGYGDPLALAPAEFLVARTDFSFKSIWGMGWLASGVHRVILAKMESIMDYFTLVYYGLICGVLGVSAPWLEHRAVRFAVGLSIGVVAAILLPYLKTMVAG